MLRRTDSIVPSGTSSPKGATPFLETGVEKTIGSILGSISLGSHLTISKVAELLVLSLHRLGRRRIGGRDYLRRLWIDALCLPYLFAYVIMVPILTFRGSWDHRVPNGPWLLFGSTLGTTEAMSQRDEVARLIEAASMYSAEQYQESTRKQQTKAFQRWSDWCRSLNFNPLTPPHAALRLFATHLCVDLGFKASTVSSTLSHINAVFRSKGIRQIDDPEIKGILLGKKRLDETPAQQATPIFPSDVARVAGLLALSNSGQRDLAMMTVGIAGFLRPSEIVNLVAADFDFASDYSGMRILLRKSKTDRQRTGQWVSIDAVPGSSVCPVRSLLAWLLTANISDGPVFPQVLMDDSICHGVAMGYDNLVSMAKARAVLMGIDPTHVSGHSFRRGGLTSAAIGGVPLSQCKRHGRWSGRAVDRYFDDIGYFRAKICSQFMDQ